MGKCCGKGKKSGDFIQDALERTGKKGKPRGKGTLTNQAEAVGMSVAQFAKQVVAEPTKYNKITKQRVNLYKTLRRL